MADDTLITPVKTETLPPVAAVYPELDVQQKAKEPNKFLKVLGGVASTALNFVAPGLGGILGNVIGGGGSSFGSYSALMEQQRQFEEMQRYSQIFFFFKQKTAYEMMNQQQQNSMQL